MTRQPIDSTLVNMIYALSNPINMLLIWRSLYAGPLFTKRAEVLPQDLAKSQSREIRA